MLIVTAAGCPSPKEEAVEEGDAGALPRASVTLRVAVVSDASLRRAIDRLRGEWNERTDGQIETIEVAADADLAAAAADADLIVFPSRAIGELCEAEALRPVRSNVLESDALRFDDFLPLVRDQEIVYAQQVMALPIGCPTPLHLCPDASENSLTTAVTKEDPQLALAYLAWAAPYLVHRSRIATLFDSDTFRPRLAEPPFVRALTNFVGSHGEGRGQIVWPLRDEPLPGGFTPQVMPAAAEVYNPIAEEWEPLPYAEQFATLVASSGRLVGVTTSSRNAATAFRYAEWLVSPENSRLVSTASDNVANCRGSFARSPDAWRATDDRDLSKEFAEAEADALRLPRFLLAPRLPGGDEYLQVLGKHVREALDGRPAGEALQQAADTWEAIGHARGWETQRDAFARSLNAAPFPESR
ncbi:hypothetical protein Pla108_29840 [Botrimarina colliarenosi]|uniref:Bacterial extracellular solute-binding protein n=1 Tax=Botrimarina colliarenosi TaxID=2528001 RepID=A0A5C6A990_9BACT|nr:hypothetical protein Pla108_29840 [Botrimarina colliarenosi]